MKIKEELLNRAYDAQVQQETANKMELIDKMVGEKNLSGLAHHYSKGSDQIKAYIEDEINKHMRGTIDIMKMKNIANYLNEQETLEESTTMSTAGGTYVTRPLKSKVVMKESEELDETTTVASTGGAGSYATKFAFKKGKGNLLEDELGEIAQHKSNMTHMEMFEILEKAVEEFGEDSDFVAKLEEAMAGNIDFDNPEGLIDNDTVLEVNEIVESHFASILEEDLTQDGGALQDKLHHRMGLDESVNIEGDTEVVSEGEEVSEVEGVIEENEIVQEGEEIVAEGEEMVSEGEEMTECEETEEEIEMVNEVEAVEESAPVNECGCDEEMETLEEGAIRYDALILETYAGDYAFAYPVFDNQIGMSEKELKNSGYHVTHVNTIHEAKNSKSRMALLMDVKLEPHYYTINEATLAATKVIEKAAKENAKNSKDAELKDSDLLDANAPNPKVDSKNQIPVQNPNKEPDMLKKVRQGQEDLEYDSINAETEKRFKELIDQPTKSKPVDDPLLGKIPAMENPNADQQTKVAAEINAKVEMNKKADAHDMYNKAPQPVYIVNDKEKNEMLKENVQKGSDIIERGKNYVITRKEKELINEQVKRMQKLIRFTGKK